MDKKLIVFLGGGLAIGGAFFAWYFLFGSDMVQREQARKPIAQWETEWQKARRCLLGDSPKEADPTDTLAIRALDEIEIHCPLSELGRPEGQGSGIPEIEDAWGKIETAWHALAAAVPDPEKMGAQIRALDAADAQLRDGAKMPALDTPKPTRAIADLTLGPVLASGGELSIDPPARNHALWGAVGDATLGLVDAKTAIVRHDRAGVVRSWPDPRPDASWGAAYDLEGGQASIAMGPVAPDGSLGAGAEVVMRGNVEGVIATIGGGSVRWLVVRMPPKDPDAEGALATVRTNDGGTTWLKPETIPGTWDLPFYDPRDAQVAVVGHREDLQPAWLLFDRVTMKPTIVPGAMADPSRICFAGTVWYGSAEDETQLLQASTLVPASPPLVFDDRPEMLACTTEAVAVRVHEKIRRCTPGACDDGLTVPNHVGFADVFDGSGVVFAAQSGRVVGVWRTGLAPVYDRAPAGAKLVGVAIWDKTPYLAFATTAGLQVAPMK